MPKSRGKKKGKGRSGDSDLPKFPGISNGFSKGYERTESHDEDTRSEVSSAISVQSEPPSDRSCGSQGGDDVEETTVVEEAENKVKEALEGLTEKSAKHRQDCLSVIIKAFSTCDMADLLESHRETLSDALERCLKRGKAEEKSLAAVLVALYMIQLGSDETNEEIFRNFKSVLLPIILDQSASLKARAKCCEALGVCCFVAAEGMTDIVECMKKFESIFRASYKKGDGSLPNVNQTTAELHHSALSAWGLLLSICHWTYASEIVKSHLHQLPDLLQSSDVFVRITAGETIALLYEILYTEDEEQIASRCGDEEELIERLQMLATDSNKYRAKKDRRQQRSSFRDILGTVKEGTAPEFTIKFGHEALVVDSWTRKRQYEALRDIIGTGINFHLKANSLLRDIFELGLPLPDAGAKSTRGSHFERHLYNQAAFKARTKARGRLRDKRTAFRT